MHVLHCIPSMEGGGAERQLACLAGELVRQGCRVDVALTRGGVNRPRLEATGARVHDLGSGWTHDPRLFVRLLRTIGRVKPDLVQCWLLQMEVLGGLAALARGLPWVFTERSSEGAYPPRMKQSLRRGVASLSSAIVANSNAGDAYWQRRLPPSLPRYVVRNGLLLGEIAGARPADLRQETGLTDPVVLFAGRFDDGKNAAALLQALRHTRAPIAALLCGEGPLRPAIEHRAAEFGLGERVRVAGFATNLWSLLKSVSALVSPSRFEGSPNVVLEAMAAGCPLVVSDIPAHREILDPDSALFFDPDDAAALARALDGVVSEPDAARRRAGRARILAERHGIADVAGQYIRIYEDVLQRRAGARMRVTT
jgi:glycosyltransferase involved in cell wall biosynthesis